jgi:hypothetical protein
MATRKRGASTPIPLESGAERLADPDRLATEILAKSRFRQGFFVDLERRWELPFAFDYACPASGVVCEYS